MLVNYSQKKHFYRVCRDILKLRLFFRAKPNILFLLIFFHSEIINAQDIVLKLSPQFYAKQTRAKGNTRAAILQKTHKFAIKNISPVLKNAKGTPLDGVWIIHPQGNSDQILKELNQDNEIEYIQLNHVFQVNQSTVNDSLFERQWGMQAIRATDAWKIETGRKEILLAVIDTGIDYTHPDLQNQLWINPGEDINSNQIVDSLDFNGIDDDGNGFIDDIRGWDFTDALRFIDNGDFAERDNDPDDEHGHGTMVCGVIAAEANNEIGIAGLAHGCQVMNLRAGTGGGLLEEDDVAAAIVYAVKNGARVINMSFGDVVVSPMLRDVVRYAYENDVVLIASSGNSGTDLPHYPSGFSETISVGATQESRSIASFSNFGQTLDLTAPGDFIRTTAHGGKYSTFGGTSAAAPFVTATTGLILSQQPDLDVESVRAILNTSADDFGEPGWDPVFGSGQLNAASALATENAPVAELVQPRMDSGARQDQISILGTAAAANLKEFSLSYGAGDNPTDWTQLATFNNHTIVTDTLFNWDISSLSDTTYIVRLQVWDNENRLAEDKIRLFIDWTAPIVRGHSIVPLINGNHRSNLIHFRTDDICAATLFWRLSGKSNLFEKVRLDYETNSHSYNFSEKLTFGAAVQFYFEFRNQAGLLTTDDNDGNFYNLNFKPVPTSNWQFDGVRTEIGAGLLLPQMTDFDNDGLGEIITAPYDPDGRIGKTTIFEWQPQTGFSAQLSTDTLAIPRDVGDSDGDGLLELLVGNGNLSQIYESTTTAIFPANLIWSNDDSFWAARFGNFDEDSQQEIIARKKNEWQIWKYLGASKYTQIASLPNPTEGSNASGVPHAEIADFDGDGLQEILFGDYDGDIFIYEIGADNKFTATWTARQPLIDASDFLTTGDFNGDGHMDFAVATHSDPADDLESQFDSRHWLVRIYSSLQDNSFSILWEERFFGYFKANIFDSGIGAGDIDGNVRDELILCLYPNAYIVAFLTEIDDFQIQWHKSGVMSNRAFVGSKSAGKSALYFNDVHNVLEFTFRQSQNKLLPPAYIQAKFNQDGFVSLQWPENSAAEYYRIFRGFSQDSLVRIAEVSQPAFIDNYLVTDTVYYRVASGIGQPDSLLSHLSPLIQMEASAQPEIMAINFIDPNFISLLFSEKMGVQATQISHFNLLGTGLPKSIVQATDQREILLAFDHISPGRHQLKISDLTNSKGRVLPDSEVSIDVPNPIAPLYISSGLSSENGLVQIQFSAPLEDLSALSLENYSLQPELKIKHISMSGANKINLELDNKSATSFDSGFVVIAVKNIKSRQGGKLRRGVGDRLKVPFLFAPQEVIAIYPNPFVANEHKFIKIENIRPGSNLKIFDVRGRLIFQSTISMDKTHYHWLAQKSNGKLAASGIYFLKIKTPSGKRITKKMTILR
ncbi:MAG: T9SS C-terminal target domain-containing protein [Calditrichaeota bacterium]|nr:MAG: T9SS C-terminal target domain-containing protein [Calditrichota bacterium]